MAASLTLLPVEPFYPGQPIDLRTEAMRVRAFTSYLGDLELAAARVIARLTGERVIIQDDNSAQHMADLRIDYHDRPPAFVEVVADVEPSYAQMTQLVLRDQEILAPELGRIWYVTVAQTVNLRVLRSALAGRLRALQDAGALFEHVGSAGELSHNDHEAARQLAALGVVQILSRPARADEDPRILLYPCGVGGAAGPDWPAFHTWASEYLHGSKRADVRHKLAATDASERHVFVALTFSTPWPAYHSLSDEYRELPDQPPRLPAEITHLWAWAYPIGRCLAWFPHTGWFDPSTQWATG